MAANVTIDFCVAGFSKCGTTSLCAALAQHPDIFIPAVKEPRYFSSDRFKERAAAYEKMYAPASPHQKLGDGSPVYSAASRAEIAIPRIKANNPDCRFIFIARHPRKRIESFYREMHHNGAHYGVRPPFSMGEFLEDYPQAIQDTLFLDRISLFVESFSQEAVLPVFLEDFHTDMHNTLQRCCEHIGVNPQVLPQVDKVKLNTGSEKLHDTKILRWLWDFPRARFLISQFSPERQNIAFRRWGLRRPFGKRPIPWDEKSERLYHENVVPKARRYLEFCDKPTNFWKL